MAIAITDKSDLPDNDNIVVGHAQLTARCKGKKLFWELPGGGTITNRLDAKAYAERLDKVIKSNVKRCNRSLVWS